MDFLTEAQKKAVQLLTTHGSFMYAQAGTRYYTETTYGADSEETRLKKSKAHPTTRFWVYDRTKSVWDYSIKTISAAEASKLINKGIAKLTIQTQYPIVHLELTDYGKLVAIQLSNME